MKNIKLMIAALLVYLALIAVPANAGPYYGHGGHWSGGCFGCGLFLFDALLATDVAIKASQQPVVVQPAPVYVQPAPVYETAPAAASATWYYCKSSNMYYPYTQACPEGWQPVAATPPH